MRVAPPLDLGEAVRIPRGGRGAAGEPQIEARNSVAKRRHRHAPAARPRGRVAEGKVPAQIDERARNPELLQGPERLLRGVSLGDGAQIEAHARPFEARRAAVRIQREQPVAAPRAGRGQFRGRRRLPHAPGAAPELDAGADGDIEGAFRRGRELLGAREHAPEIVAQGDEAAAPRGAQAAELAGGIVIAHNPLDRPGTVKGGLGRAACRFLIAGIQYQVHGRSHNGSRELEAPGRLGRAGVRRAGQQRRDHSAQHA